MKSYPVTPDGRYFVCNRRLWRCTDPSLAEDRRQELVDQLMAARREVKSALKSHTEESIARARANVHQAKISLGERGPVWWKDNAPDLNQRLVDTTPYEEWFKALESTRSRARK